MKIMKGRLCFLNIIFSFSLLSVLFSCSTPKNIAYFKGATDTTIVKQAKLATFQQPTIKEDDILSVNIQTIDPDINGILNPTALSASSGSGGGGQGAPGQQISGLLVNRAGTIEMPLLGKINVLGLTTDSAAEVIRAKASGILKSPTVQVRFANYKITVLGEVTKPGTYSMPNEKVSVLDVIGLAGDLTIYGKRENVTVVRDSADKKVFMHLNLNSADCFKSSGFYLKQNDLVYVEPNKAKASVNNTPRLQAFGLIATFLSLFVLIITRIN